ncbi:MAG TPA: ATP-dependent Clp protease proteolytic subunit [Tepidisphaeraceae bacterium]|nr:ATP-dependent Clp protease proteolytic subunit [Tepidisphaeraceae bacterium]
MDNSEGARFGRTRLIWTLMLVGICMQCFGLARADTIYLQNGRRYDGDVVAEDSKTVTIRVEVPESVLSFNQKIDKSHIKRWDRPNRQGAPYLRVPVIGDIGDEVTVDSIRTALTEARQYHPKFVLLIIDSNGGRVDTTQDICALITDPTNKFKIVACVTKAYSGAAMIAMACKDIFMMPGSVIGAAVPLKFTPHGPRDIQAKIASAIEAKQRTYVTAAGHDDLLLRGMMEINLPIYLRSEGGKPVLDTSGPGAVLKARGQILCLSADDAVKCGLARSAINLADVGKHLAGGRWYECSEQPWDAAMGTVASADKLKQDQSFNAQHYLSRLNGAVPQIAEIRQKINESAAKISSNKTAIETLVAKCNSRIDQIILDYHEAVKQAENQTDSAYLIARAKETARDGIANARLERDLAIKPLQDQIDMEIATLNNLRRQENGVLAGISEN